MCLSVMPEEKKPTHPQKDTKGAPLFVSGSYQLSIYYIKNNNINDPL